MLTAITKSKLQAIQMKLSSLSFRMAGRSTSDLDKDVSTIGEAVRDLVQALLSEPEQK
jgi:hypothetical protein